MNNAIQVIFPYLDHGVWMFDDDSKGLVREPFVCGIPQMMDTLVADIPDAGKGFALYFSAEPFPAYQLRVNLIGPESGGNWYELTFNGNVMKGWLCPALFQYFETAPATIYAKAERLNVQNRRGR